MWWILAAKAADGLLQGMAGRATAKANNRISRANAETGNATRQYKNAATAATNNLARWQQSLNNQRALKAGGEQLEANTQNYLRSADAHSYDDINRALGDAEQLGAQAAAAGNVGAIGGVVDMVDTSTRIRAGIVEAMTKTQTSLAKHDNAKRAGMIFSQTVQGLDSSLILDSFDYTVDYMQETPVMSHFANAFQGFMSTFGSSGQGWDTMKNWNNSQARSTPQTVESPYSLAGASNAKFGFRGPPDNSLPSSDNGWSLWTGGSRVFSTSESYKGSGSVNPYSLWGSNG